MSNDETLNNDIMTHTDLCKKTAERFVKSLAIYESTFSIAEKPDVLNFDSSGRTELYEIKMSRSDFLIDKKKLARKKPIFGDKRYFVCYGTFIKEDEVPEGWGLYYYKNNKFYKQKDSIDFSKDKNQQLRTQKFNTMLLTNLLICEKTNIVFSKRVLENREKWRKRKSKSK